LNLIELVSYLKRNKSVLLSCCDYFRAFSH
jgi:hypothetical protein